MLLLLFVFFPFLVKSCITHFLLLSTSQPLNIHHSVTLTSNDAGFWRSTHKHICLGWKCHAVWVWVIDIIGKSLSVCSYFSTACVCSLTVSCLILPSVLLCVILPSPCVSLFSHCYLLPVLLCWLVVFCMLCSVLAPPLWLGVLFTPVSGFLPSVPQSPDWCVMCA